MKTVKSLILTGFGINCEEEMSAAYRLAGADSQVLHINEIFLKNVSIHNYDILNFPGGFSFGDDIASGKILANKIKYKKLNSGKTFLDEILKFLKDGKFILGICNGFQILVKLGLLPNINKTIKQEVTLTMNDSGKFEDRWVYCKVHPQVTTPFLKGINLMRLPVRHGEGKLIISDNKIKNHILENSLNCLSYSDLDGNITDKYPMNPNGSELNCAGLSNETGQILGIMPHPEAYLSLYNNPNWSQIKRKNPKETEEGEGLKLFKNIVRYIEK